LNFIGCDLIGINSALSEFFFITSFIGYLSFLINMYETAVNREISRTNLIYLGEENHSAKLVGSRERFTMVPYCSPTGLLAKFPPAIITRGQASKWKNAGKKKTEIVINPAFDSKKPENEKNKKQLEVNFREFEKCRVYFNKAAWMTRAITIIEMQRLSRYLRLTSPGKKFGIYLDNCPAHSRLPWFDNLEFIFLKPGTTGIFQFW
jgi:hypothetical protein